MKDTKKLADLFARFPNRRVLDGTMGRMSYAELRIYLAMTMWMNYRTKEGRVSNKAIAKYCNVTSGPRIKEAIHNLEFKHKLIFTWIKHKKRKDGQPSRHTVRWYKILP